MSEDTGTASSWRNPHFLPTAGSVRATESLLLGARLKQQLKDGWALGSFVMELPAPATLHILAVAGFDYAILDLEHTGLGLGRLEQLIQAGRAAGLPMLVRTWGHEAGLIGKILDMGAHGIMAPHVESAAQAEAVVSQARFPPLGERGFAPITSFDALGEPLAELESSTFVVVQIEGRAALERASQIASVPGVDAVFIGPYDLALSLGVEPGSEPVFAAARSLAKSIPDTVALGIYVDDPANCGTWADLGFTLQCASFDARMLANGARAVIGAARPGDISKRAAP